MKVHLRWITPVALVVLVGGLYYLYGTIRREPTGTTTVQHTSQAYSSVRIETLLPREGIEIYPDGGDGLVCIGDDYLVMSSRNDSQLILMTRDGKIIEKVGQKGEGPGEFHTPSFLVFEEKSDLLWVVDGRLTRISRFAFSDGHLEYRNSFISQAVRRRTPSPIIVESDSTYWTNPSGQMNRIALYDKDVRILRSFGECSQEYESRPGSNLIINSGFLLGISEELLGFVYISKPEIELWSTEGELHGSVIPPLQDLPGKNPFGAGFERKTGRPPIPVIYTCARSKGGFVFVCTIKYNNPRIYKLAPPEMSIVGQYDIIEEVGPISSFAVDDSQIPERIFAICDHEYLLVSISVDKDQ